MKFKFKPKLSLIFLISVTSLLGLLVVASNNVEGVLFSLTGNTKIPDVTCWAKSSTVLGGKEVAKSAFLTDNPTFNLLTVKDVKEINSNYDHTGKIRCTFPSGNADSTKIPVIIQSGSEFKISSYAYQSGVDEKVLAFTEVKRTTNDIELFWNTENDFITYSVPMKNVVDVLKDGKYDATVETHIQGNLIMHYKGYDHTANLWKFPIKSLDIPTWFTFPIDKSTGSKTGGVEVKNGADNLEVKNTKNISNDSFQEFVECAKVVNTECLFNEKFNLIWGVLVIGVFGLAYLERSRK